jgi:hypothetical protein
MAEAVTAGRKPKQGNLVKNEGIAIYAMTKDPWYKVSKYMKILPPWAKLRGGWSYIKNRYPDTMYKVTLAFKSVAEATAGWERWARRDTIAKALKGKSFGGKPRPKGRVPTKADIEAVLRMV